MQRRSNSYFRKLFRNKRKLFINTIIKNNTYIAARSAAQKNNSKYTNPTPKKQQK